MGGGHELPWADHSHIQTALKHKNNLNLNISTSQRNTWLLCSDIFKKWGPALRAGDKGDKGTFFWMPKENVEEKGKREIWRNGRAMWKMLLRTGLEAQSWKARSAKRSFPLPKGVSGDPLAHREKGCGEREEGGEVLV